MSSRSPYPYPCHGRPPCSSVGAARLQTLTLCLASHGIPACSRETPPPHGGGPDPKLPWAGLRWRPHVLWEGRTGSGGSELWGGPTTHLWVVPVLSQLSQGTPALSTGDNMQACLLP